MGQRQGDGANRHVRRVGSVYAPRLFQRSQVDVLGLFGLGTASVNQVRDGKRLVEVIAAIPPTSSPAVFADA